MCRIDYADSDGLWMIDPADRRANKDHRCGDCNRVILKGETYTYGKWLEHGEGFHPIKMCQQCVAAGRWLRKVCGGHMWPGVLEELREHWDEEWDLRSNGLAWLIEAGRARWQRRGQLIPPDVVTAWADRAIAAIPTEALHR